MHGIVVWNLIVLEKQNFVYIPKVEQSMEIDVLILGEIISDFFKLCL